MGLPPGSSMDRRDAIRLIGSAAAIPALAGFDTDRLWAIGADTQLALARRTEWQEQDEWFLGRGQRMLATDADEYPLMDVRRVNIAAAPAIAAAARSRRQPSRSLRLTKRVM